MLPHTLGGSLPRCSLLLRATFATLANATGARRGGRLPHSKQKVSAKRPTFQSTQTSRNAPALVAKYLRHAERVAFELGVTEELQAFNAAAVAFPNPPVIVASTCVAFFAAGRCHGPFVFTHTAPSPPLPSPRAVCWNAATS